MKEEKKNLKQIDDETLSHLDDNQLQEIAGGVKSKDTEGDQEDETCAHITCGCTPTMVQ